MLTYWFFIIVALLIWGFLTVFQRVMSFICVLDFSKPLLRPPRRGGVGRPMDLPARALPRPARGTTPARPSTHAEVQLPILHQQSPHTLYSHTRVVFSCFLYNIGFYTNLVSELIHVLRFYVYIAFQFHSIGLIVP